MARKIIDTYPVFTLTIGKSGPPFQSQTMTRREAEDARAEALDSLRTVFTRDLGRNFDMEHKLVEDAVCEHCNYTWTEGEASYNGGCCGKDEANNPARLVELLDLARQVADGGFYDVENTRTPINWPDLMADAAIRWLDAGRPPEGVAALLPLIKRVVSRDWCTKWTDPGPSDAALARLPDRIDIDGRPDRLGGELLSLIDDMDLLPANQPVPA